MIAGPRVLDEVLTPLMRQLLEEEEGEEEKERREVVLDGLRHVMAVKSKVVLPVMVPRLIQPPVNTRALALLSSVAGPALHSHLNRVIPALVSSLEGVQVRPRPLTGCQYQELPLRNPRRWQRQRVWCSVSRKSQDWPSLLRNCSRWVERSMPQHEWLLLACWRLYVIAVTLPYLTTPPS